MKFLNNLPPYLFFTGKGGVGKTSISCATALHLVEQGKRVLLVSTDPASNVAQVFNQVIGNQITAITQIEHLSAIEIDPQQAAEQYRQRIVGPLQGLLPSDALRSIEEQLSGACTTEIAAFDEFTDLLTNPELAERFDHIVFDTAPTGHTIRLLQLPGAWSSFIEANPEGASCLGPMAGLEKQREQYAHAVSMLADAKQTRLILVARAQRSALEEVARTYQELYSLGIKQQCLVVNGRMPESAARQDPLAASIRQREQAALQALPEILQGLSTDTIDLKADNMVGIKALASLLQTESILEKMPTQISQIKVESPTLANMIDDIAEDKHGLIMLMGKGGVGKTTLAASIAVGLANKGFDVHLTTSDPAAHLRATLQGELPNLQVSRIDPQEETERYRQHVLATKGKNLSAAEKALLEEDLRSPCTEEIATFQAFSRAIRDSAQRFVVMDTAPTGHTLLLLDATGAYHKEIAKKMGDNQRFTTPLMQLQDPTRTKVLIATLAETTPVLEAKHLQDDLARAGIHPWGWIVNNALSVATIQSPLLQQRAQQEYQQIKQVKAYAQRIALVPMLVNEPVGIEALSQMAHSAH
ncbi:arsenical pump-driving ATPase [Vibrio metschnikovii]|uniref:Arsenical pump-driving ATPase n=2 Tax=Unclassified Bacteria TaxID=49928 RepID=A0AAU6US49_UNCXX|nr:arsenical pump-driving ATPase [Vibrio metschnikovii]EKO3725465.1 arsenical pump-driving ATPase [Vibrio metschnikovii]EKO3794935.1 arsenical pump-driving ATPase [Vibrio metschnikovii]EKO3938706.1 arsenical pump-driving ATPase [Vibrio metschnikovii]